MHFNTYIINKFCLIILPTGSGPGLVSGWTSKDGTHKAIAFSVLWSNGASATAWTGLCHVCQGQEIIKTTWILTSEVDTCDDHWSSNRLGFFFLIVLYQREIQVLKKERQWLKVKWESGHGHVDSSKYLSPTCHHHISFYLSRVYHLKC